MNDPKKVEVLKVWYVAFVTIMSDIPGDPQPDEWRMQKLKQLRERLRQEAPELENN